MSGKSQNAGICRQESGFTLLEIIIALSLLSILISASACLFAVSLRSWDTGSLRTEIRDDMNYAMDKILRNLKETANASLRQYNSTAHTIQYNDLSGRTYVLYLYNPDDATLDSTYSEGLYDLRRADISGGDMPSSGGGVSILKDLVSPDGATPATSLTIEPGGTQVTLDFVVRRSDETVRIRTKVRPRNL
jgi:prepilin-type N-terminal cleavage/methylation domain-containing protein